MPSLWREPSSAALRRLFGDRRGTTAIEFGFVGLVFVTLLLGAIDLGRYQFTMQSLRERVALEARKAVIAANGGAVGTTTNPTPFLDPALLELEVEGSGPDANGVRTITVRATYPFQFVAPFVNLQLPPVVAELSY